MKKVLKMISVICFLTITGISAQYARGDDSTTANVVAIDSSKVSQGSTSSTTSASTTSSSDTTKASASSLQGQLEKLYPGLKILKNVTISGYLDLTYEYNFNNPKSGINNYRIFDTESNGFAVRMFQLMIDDPTNNPGDVGFRVRLDFGEDAKIITPYGFSTSIFDLEEAYVTYKAPVGKGLDLTFGKWEEIMGEEVIESKDDYNVSRSFLDEYAEPFTHTGLKASYTFNDKVSGLFAVINGWDDVEDNNSQVKPMAQVTITPIAPLSLAFTGIYGPEEYHDNHDDRAAFDFVATYKATNKLTLVTNYDYGNEPHAGLGGIDADWQGVAEYVNYVFTPKIDATARVEWFTDPEGARTGTAQDLVECTLTGDYKLNDNFRFRAEYRHDHSNVASFENSTGGFNTDDNTISFETIFTF